MTIMQEDRSWPLILFVAALVLLVSGMLLWVAISGIGRKTISSSVLTVPPQENAAASGAMFVPRAIDGIRVPATEAHLLPFAVMIDNHADARPSAGLAAANLVFEAPVEGGLTRYLAIYDATSTAEMIGPVRSARTYFVEIAESLNAAYVHLGGSPEALEKLKKIRGFRNLDEIANGAFFWRSGKRSPPHHVFTRMDLLRSAALVKDWHVAPSHLWSYKEDAPLESTTTTVRGRGQGPSVAYGGASDVSWTYDRTSNAYLRTLARKPHVDADGTRVQAKNVVMMLTDAHVVDAEGRLALRTTGRGAAIVAGDGRTVPAAWQRSPGEMFQLYGIDGTDVFLNRGTTWIEIVTSKEVFEKAATLK